MKKLTHPIFLHFLIALGMYGYHAKNQDFFPDQWNPLKQILKHPLIFYVVTIHTYIENTIKLGGIVVSTSKLGQIVRQRCEPSGT